MLAKPHIQPAAGNPPLTEQEQLQLQALLRKFQDLFDEPRGLPPNHHHEHQIPMKEGATPVNLRPYRYPPIQKTVIEKMVDELLTAGMIRNNNSPYASPMVLVKKSDGTWRLCVDYRQLNNDTIKGKFPIPVIEELIEELHDAIFFS
ncbi:hypothetical protein KSP39_PZI021330 [Platanthera zijinensis]|uniref:Uncharacterized protein n=1 Tax=Platanthera zijinensis TaxID=2320716 RepID=A0AAP0AY45_9ASPA